MGINLLDEITFYAGKDPRERLKRANPANPSVAFLLLFFTMKNPSHDLHYCSCIENKT